MSLFEWWGERNNRSAVGQVVSDVPLPVTASAGELYARGFFGAVFIVVAVLLLAQTENPELWLVLFFAYLVLAYRVRVQPDYSNVGLMGGFIDHPFRWSDDINRQLAFLRIVLMPGRFAVGSVRDAIQRARGKRVMVLPIPDRDEPDGED